MSAYININTLEYPRHEGDIALDPQNQYAVVQWVDMPSFDSATQRCYEGAPEQIDGQWRMTWIVRDATQKEIDRANQPFNSRFPWLHRTSNLT
jgi:hypothetical protein